MNPADLYVLTSDAAHCVKSASVEVLPTGATGNNVKYKRFYYTCYVGPGWFGRVGVVRTDSANTNDRVCIGDPAVSSSTNLTSTHPQLATTRDYRGFKDTNDPTDSVYDITVGIGMDATNANAADWTYLVKHYGNFDIDSDGNLIESGSYSQPADFDNTTTVNLERQDFLITTISGNPGNSDCKAKLVLLNSTSGEEDQSPFYQNDGKFVCLTRNSGNGSTPTFPIGCPTTYPTNAAPTTLITLNFTSGSQVVSVATDGGSCTAVSGNSATCTIDYRMDW